MRYRERQTPGRWTATLLAGVERSGRRLTLSHTIGTAAQKVNGRNASVNRACARVMIMERWLLGVTDAEQRAPNRMEGTCR